MKRDDPLNGGEVGKKKVMQFAPDRKCQLKKDGKKVVKYSPGCGAILE